MYYNVCIIWLIKFVIKIKCYKNRCKCISFTTIFWMYPSQNAHYFHVYLDKRNYTNYPNWLHRSKLVIQRVYTFGKRSENFAYAEVIPPSKFNNYGWTGYGEFVEYVEIRRRRIGGWMIDRRFYYSFRWWHPEGEETSRAIIILFSILEMRPKEFRGLSNCEMSRDTSSLFPLPATNRETKNLLLLLSMKIFAIFSLPAKIDTAFCRRYSSFSIPSIG